MHIVLAGFGNMGQALAKGWLEAGAVDGRITVLDPEAAARSRASELGLESTDSAAGLAGPIDVAVLAVKPAAIEAVLGDLPRASLYLSIAAGRKIADIARIVGEKAAIVRAMPNTPAAVGLGVTGLCANATAGAADRKVASRLMSAVGSVEWLDDEADMDALTAVSGSGPAYVFLLIECLTAAAVDAGLEPALAERLATATVRGAGAYATASGLDAATLRRQVTSPNGTTEAALAVLMEGDALGKLVRGAVREAARRSRELAGLT
ncbi:MAG TPA: pyrroline-5-carboxylate reductase [Gammaproteobacteria bacterium]|nr:pyrroline-5-carboxylate reductase [Gammaproteobacteria bacterium]